MKVLSSRINVAMLTLCELLWVWGLGPTLFAVLLEKGNVWFYCLLFPVRRTFISIDSESVGLYSGNVRSKGREWKMRVFEQGWGRAAQQAVSCYASASNS